MCHIPACTEAFCPVIVMWRWQISQAEARFTLLAYLHVYPGCETLKGTAITFQTQTNENSTTDSSCLPTTSTASSTLPKVVPSWACATSGNFLRASFATVFSFSSFLSAMKCSFILSVLSWFQQHTEDRRSYQSTLSYSPAASSVATKSRHSAECWPMSGAANTTQKRGE